MPSEELWKMSATEVVRALRQGDLEPKDAIEAAISRIEAVDGDVNALPIHCFERAFDQAKKN